MTLAYTGILGQFTARGGLLAATRVPLVVLTPPQAGAYRPEAAYGTAITYDLQPIFAASAGVGAPAPTADSLPARIIECR